MEEREAQSRRRTIVPVVLVVGALVAVSAFIGIGLVTFQDDQYRGLGTLAGTSVDRATLPQTVPFRSVGGHIVVDVAIAGAAEPRPMILDTGAPSFLSNELADSDGSMPGGTISTLSVDGEIVESEVVTVPTLHIGDAAFTNVGAVRGFVGAWSPLWCISQHGLIGANVMADAVWQIDHTADRLTIAAATAGLDHVDRAVRVPFVGAGGASPSPIIELRIGETTLPVLVDTGSDGWLTIHPADLEAAGISLDPDAPALVTLGAGASGSFMATLRYSATDVATADGALELPGLPIATTEAIAEGQGNIGNEFLSHFVVTIDWPDQVIYLDPLDSHPRPAAPPSATITWDGSDLVVGSVVLGTPGYQDAVVVEARVLAVDGEDVSEAAVDEACALIASEPPDTFEMTVLSDAARTVRVFPVDVFSDSPAFE